MPHVAHQSATRTLCIMYNIKAMVVLNLEIINNTRGGICTGNISRKRERTNGGQIQVPDALYSDGQCSFHCLKHPGLEFAPISALPNFALNASSSVIYNLYGT